MNVFEILKAKIKAKLHEPPYQHTGEDYYTGLCDAEGIILDVEQEYNNGWIDCTKELPPQPSPNPEFENKPLEIYMVSVKYSKYPFRAFWNGKIFTDGFSKIDPIAWQPLPESYKGV